MWVNRYYNEHNLERHPQPGKVRKLDVIDMNTVGERVLDNSFTNAAIVGREFGVHRDTVRKVWKDMGIHHHWAPKKPALTQAQREERVGYDLENLTRDWSNVIFSDDKTFQTDRHQKAHVYRPPNCRYDGWISRDGPAELSVISGRLNSVGYIELLEDNLVRTVDICYGGLQNVVFMQVTSGNFT